MLKPISSLSEQMPSGSGWIAYEKSGCLAFAQVERWTEKAARLAGGEKISCHRIWLRDMPPSLPALRAIALQRRQTLDIRRVWEAAAGRALTPVELTAAVAAGDGGEQDEIAECLAVIMLVLANPIYFTRRDGRFTPAGESVLAQALESQERRRQQENLERMLLSALEQGEVPPVIADEMNTLLFAPDKTTLAYRVLRRHLGGDGVAFARFFIKSGGLSDARAYWDGLFRATWPPAHPDIQPPPPPSLPVATAMAFSIDNVGTIEIDDAFSVQSAGSDWKIGIHIAAPALVIDGVGAAAAQERQISVYFPDEKHCMLPPAYIAACSLSEAAARPALSLYLRYNPQTGALQFGETVLEAVRLGAVLTPAAVEAGDMPQFVRDAYAKLKNVCAVIADTAPPLERYPVDFKITTSPLAVEKRERTEVSMIVEKLMRTINGFWGAQLAKSGRGGLFRVDGMTRTKRPSGASYMWLSSPLRRYVDLMNQRLLLAQLGVGAPPVEKWSVLAPAFDRRYTQAKNFQRLMERHWALQALAALPEGACITGEYEGGKRVQLSDYPLIGHLLNYRRTTKGELRMRIVAIDFLYQRLELQQEE